MVMGLNLRELEVFRAVMEAGGVTGAAAQLGMSQPAASKMLRQAEARLGFALFARDRNRMVPTAEAHALLPELMGAFAAIGGVERLAAALRAGRSGQLTIAAVPVLATALLPRAIQAFRDGRPEVMVRLRATTALEAVNQVAEHRAEIGVILGHSGDPRVEATALARSEIGCALPPRHRLAAKRRLSLVELAGEAVISLSPQQPVGAALGEAQGVVHIAIEVSQSSIACALVRAGAGIALLDGYGLAEARAQGLATRPVTPRLELAVTMVVSRARAPSLLAEAFRERLVAAAA
ncbi:LysR family transcriptional regulator [Roseomonas stagni]|uniref:LysR family transcriptional regulator n=1 Tax=Falsiroseomonas algicola TaxID=2716930 RepID=A0A6M1LIY4_9PROT|nr:LysR family transcriptional regulator [Falsiroseomonas algicola]NGM19874.1 LysR family transcriptional regulator [Falsiroseomonas algicola]